MTRLSYQTQLRIFLLPYIAGILLLTLIPAIASFLIAFTQYDATGAPLWVGLTNFRELFASDLARLSLRNSFIFLIAAVPLRLAAALLLALLLRQGSRAFGIYRAAIFLPTIIPEAAYALIWLWIFNPLFGPLNLLLHRSGLPTPAWLAEPGTAVAAMIIMSVFQMGEGFVVLLAGLQTIPCNLYESAQIDGANRWQSFWRITFPLIAPWLLLLTCRDLIMSLQNSFAPTYIMTYGGPYYATTFAPLLIYELAFDLLDLGKAAALLALVYAGIGLLIAGILSITGVQGSADAV